MGASKRHLGVRDPAIVISEQHCDLETEDALEPCDRRKRILVGSGRREDRIPLGHALVPWHGNNYTFCKLICKPTRSPLALPGAVPCSPVHAGNGRERVGVSGRRDEKTSRCPTARD